MFTVGIAVAEYFGRDDKKVNKLKQLVTFPPLIALFLGLALSGISLPIGVDMFLERLGAAAIPLILISVGLSLEIGQVRPYALLIPLAILSKLLFSPLIALIVGRAVLTEPVAFRTAVLEASMPTALLTLVIGIDFGLEREFIASVIVLTTIFSFFTLYLVQFLL